MTNDSSISMRNYPNNCMFSEMVLETDCFKELVSRKKRWRHMDRFPATEDAVVAPVIGTIGISFPDNEMQEIMGWALANKINWRKAKAIIDGTSIIVNVMLFTIS